MEGDSIRCAFVFSSAEYGRASRCFYRSGGAVWWWLGGILFLFSLPTLFPGKPEDHDAAYNSMSSAMQMIINLVPVALFVVLLTIFVLWLGWWGFRRSATFNQEMEYALSEEGIHLKNSVLELAIKWDIFVRAAENSSGFLLVQKGKRSFHWLPKRGFDNAMEIDKCRELLRRHMKDAKRLGSGG
jgi:hypothetical protein